MKYILAILLVASVPCFVSGKGVAEKLTPENYKTWTVGVGKDVKLDPITSKETCPFAYVNLIGAFRTGESDDKDYFDIIVNFTVQRGSFSKPETRPSVFVTADVPEISAISFCFSGGKTIVLPVKKRFDELFGKTYTPQDQTSLQNILRECNASKQVKVLFSGSAQKYPDGITIDLTEFPVAYSLFQKQVASMDAYMASN